MKKIKILNWSLIIFLILGVIGIIGNFVILIFDKTSFETIYTDTQFGINLFYFRNGLTCLLLFGLYQVQQSLSSFIKNSFFNSKSAKFLKKGGSILILFGVLSGINNLFYLNNTPENIITNYMMYAMIILIGIGLLAVSDIINKGEIIEQENMLTI